MSNEPKLPFREIHIEEIRPLLVTGIENIKEFRKLAAVWAKGKMRQKLELYEASKRWRKPKPVTDEMVEQALAADQSGGWDDSVNNHIKDAFSSNVKKWRQILDLCDLTKNNPTIFLDAKEASILYSWIDLDAENLNFNRMAGSFFKDF